MSAGRPRTIRPLRTLLRSHSHAELHLELARAEIARELPEIYVLTFRAILAMAEGNPDLARDYLEMAEAVASAPPERATVAAGLAACELLRSHPPAAAKRCMATRDDVCHCPIEERWCDLAIALDRMGEGIGEAEAIDEGLRGFKPIDESCAQRLLELLRSEAEQPTAHSHSSSHAHSHAHSHSDHSPAEVLVR